MNAVDSLQLLASDAARRQGEFTKAALQPEEEEEKPRSSWWNPWTAAALGVPVGALGMYALRGPVSDLIRRLTSGSGSPGDSSFIEASKARMDEAMNTEDTLWDMLEQNPIKPEAPPPPPPAPRRPGAVSRNQPSTERGRPEVPPSENQVVDKIINLLNPKTPTPAYPRAVAPAPASSEFVGPPLPKSSTPLMDSMRHMQQIERSMGSKPPQPAPTIGPKSTSKAQALPINDVDMRVLGRSMDRKIRLPQIEESMDKMLRLQQIGRSMGSKPPQLGFHPAKGGSVIPDPVQSLRAAGFLTGTR